MDALYQSSLQQSLSESALRSTAQALSDGDMDLEFCLCSCQFSISKCFQGPNGIWLPGGLKELVEQVCAVDIFTERAEASHLPGWSGAIFTSGRKKRGFGSVTNEGEVFETVDAALLHLLLLIEKSTESRGIRMADQSCNVFAEQASSHLTVQSKSCETFNRLYVLQHPLSEQDNVWSGP